MEKRVQYQYLYNLKMKRKSKFSFKAKQEEEDLIVLLLLNAMNRKPSTRSRRSFKRRRAYKRRRVNRGIDQPVARQGEEGFVGPILMDEAQEELPLVTQESFREKRDLEYDSDYEYENQPAHNLRAIE